LRGGSPRQLEGIPYKIGYILHGIDLVIMGQDDRIPFLLECEDLLPQFTIFRHTTYPMMNPGG